MFEIGAEKKAKLWGKGVSFNRLQVILVGSDSYRIESRLPDKITDELLLERAGAGDQAAFLQLLNGIATQFSALVIGFQEPLKWPKT